MPSRKSPCTAPAVCRLMVALISAAMLGYLPLVRMNQWRPISNIFSSNAGEKSGLDR